jgi:Rps23 Pro-64 3,4-dihydroxylase Tpa1-like proline 4-hydroxylase
MTRDELAAVIEDRLTRDRDVIKEEFDRPRPIKTRFAAIDDLLPEAIAHEIREAFPATSEMRLLDSFRERKYTSKSLDKFAPILAEITMAFQDPRVIDAVSAITGARDAVGDPLLYAGGISAMAKGHFLNPHIDNSHDYEQKNYRVLNLLYYCSPRWKPEFGGNLELWDDNVSEAVEIPSLFNRLVLMETNDRSWHSVNEVKADELRCCVSNYYFSPHSPNGYETAHVTFFQGRPEQKLRRMVSTADGMLRTAMRKVVKGGLAKKDVYEHDDADRR